MTASVHEIRTGDPECNARKVFDARIGKNVDPEAQKVDCVAYMTTDRVDGDDEIVLPSGCDFSRFEKNPVLLLNHAHGGKPGEYYTLPIGTVVKTTPRPHGILAHIKFSRSSKMGQEVKALFDEDMLRSFSISFRSFESSPLTREEARARPDWQAAFDRTKGRVLVHRRWELLELSVTAMPSNPDALIVRYKSLGTKVPDWLPLPHPQDQSMSTAPTEAAPGGETNPDAEPITKDFSDGDGGQYVTEGMHVKHGSECGVVKSVDGDMVNVDMHDEKCMPTGHMKCYGMKELSPFPDAEKDMAEGSGTDGGYATGDEEEEAKAVGAVAETEPSADPDHFGGPVDFDDEQDAEGDTEEMTPHVKANDHVKIHAPHLKGYGVVKSIHNDGLVPHVEEDVRASKAHPHCRVKLYKAFGDGFLPTSHHAGVHMKHVTKVGQLQPPSKRSEKTASHRSRSPMPEPPANPLPPLVALTTEQVELREIDELNEMLSPAAIKRLVREEAERAAGYV